MPGTYVLHPAGNEQFHWDLKAGNSETILSSQLYSARQGAETGIESCRANSKDDANYSRLMSQDTQPYFVLKAGNGEVIGTSQMYGSESAREAGIASCMANGPSAATRDDSK